ncbi:MAG: hypothetical protein LBN00_00365 [Oscillospiraceae bacterium]|jgi:hypothetical protein|nr:hypothetical protein [Oscillospiraceae bacterium]
MRIKLFALALLFLFLTACGAEDAVTPLSHISLIVETLGLSDDYASTIELLDIKNATLANGKTSTVYLYAYFEGTASSYRYPVLIVGLDGKLYLTDLGSGVYDNVLYLSDIDGDSGDEVIVVCDTGGNGVPDKLSYIFTFGESGLHERFDFFTGGDHDVDTGFTLTLADGWNFIVGNVYTDLRVGFEHKYDKENPYFTEDGTVIQQFDTLNTDSLFYTFEPVDIDSDGICEIVTSEYSSLWSRSDSLGFALTVLKWNNKTEMLEIIKTDFYPIYISSSDDEWEKTLEYLRTWYLD